MMFFSNHSQPAHGAWIRSSVCVAVLSLSTALHAQEQYIGALMQVAGAYCPKGWANAAGAQVSIAQNAALFSLLGTHYGGDGRTTFKLPDLRGRVPVGAEASNDGQTFTLGKSFGAEYATLTQAQLPEHTHALSIPANTGEATHAAAGDGRVIASTANGANFAAGPAPENTSLTLSSSATGGSQGLPLMEPTLGVVWCIATTGVYPLRPEP